MKLSIKSDGTATGTVISDEAGNVVEGVVAVAFSINATDKTTAIIKVQFDKIDVCGEVKE